MGMAGFVVGVVSSVAATIVLAVCTWWGRYHLPYWVAGLIKSSSSVAGSWRVSTAADPTRITGEARLRQFGSSLYGTATSEESRNGVTRHREWQLRAQVTGTLLNGIYWDAKTGVRGVVSMKISTRGNQMGGQVLYFNLDSGSWAHGPITFYRNN